MISPLVNVLGAGLYCQSDVLKIVDCTSHRKKGNEKDAPLHPIIKDLEERNPKGNNNAVIVDLVLFDRATNIQNNGKIMAMRYPRITVLRGTEHVVSILFKDFCENIPEFSLLRKFTVHARNMFGSTCHEPTSMFGSYSKKHNKGIKIGFIKLCDVKMAGEFTYSMGCTSTRFSCLLTLFII